MKRKFNTSCAEWVDDCMKWRGVVLKGEFAHWCYDWDDLPVDETTSEFESCTCFPDLPPSKGEKPLSNPGER